MAVGIRISQYTARVVLPYQIGILLYNAVDAVGKSLLCGQGAFKGNGGFDILRIDLKQRSAVLYGGKAKDHLGPPKFFSIIYVAKR